MVFLPSPALTGAGARGRGQAQKQRAGAPWRGASALRTRETAGTHAKVRYRCFLPDLAGFTSPRCPDHKALNYISRRGWDSNPRYPFRYTRFPGVRLQPLGHLSRRLTASGERRIRTYGTVTGTPDFESGAFDHSASSPSIQFSRFLRRASRSKKLFRSRPHSLRQHAARHLDAGGCAAAPRPGCRASPPLPPWGPIGPNTSRVTRPCTIAPAHIAHGSSVTYRVTPVSRQAPELRPPPASASSSAWAKGSRSTSRRLKPVPDHLALVHRHRSDGDLAQCRRFPRQRERLLHESVVVTHGEMQRREEVALPGGFEPPAFGFVVRRSIQLS